MVRSAQVAMARLRPSIRRMWLIGAMALAFYVTIVSEIVAWNDVLQIHFAELNSSYLSEVPSRSPPVMRGRPFLHIDTPGSLNKLALLQSSAVVAFPVKQANERGGLMHSSREDATGIPRADVHKDEGDLTEDTKQPKLVEDELSPRPPMSFAIHLKTNATSVSLEQNIVTLESINDFEVYGLDDNYSSSEATSSNIITPESPVFVLSLPNNGGVSIQRYFKCAGLDERALGRVFTPYNMNDKQLSKRISIGKCMRGNIRRAYNHAENRSLETTSMNPLEDCGDYLVWTEMEYITKSARGRRACFFPTLEAYALNTLFDAYPNATVINVRRDPEEWYKTLSPGEIERWPRWCNHGKAVEYFHLRFPEANATKSEWIYFYEQHNKFVQKNAQEHPSITFIDVDLESNTSETAHTLNLRLGIPESCWVDPALRKDNRSIDIRYPIFVPSLPKSATTSAYSYLNCGVGSREGVHQWTKRENETKHVPIGECMLQNIQRSRPVIEGCGDHKHWSDIGVIRPSMCYYPSFHGGLEAIYQAHPHGTIMNTIRDARLWYESAKKWARLLQRWSTECKGFPPLSANATEWINFYNLHNKQIRDFARDHPTMTYVEVNVDNHIQTRDIVAGTFAFPDSCWGHANSYASSEAMIRHRTKEVWMRLAKNLTVSKDELEWLRKRNVTLILPDSVHRGILAETKE
jgi:hypothetical protein